MGQMRTMITEHRTRIWLRLAVLRIIRQPHDLSQGGGSTDPHDNDGEGPSPFTDPATTPSSHFFSTGRDHR